MTVQTTSALLTTEYPFQRGTRRPLIAESNPETSSTGELFDETVAESFPC
ncbi:hypothetical protein MFFC18_07720 [Mariniblastus fucicola]|uniref:Uncharacterized protein n=1 Tax=Mariniblastus fucicola TaxID=980251 RepID=A0A5B9PD04_9BACT|nr:hypothetical protein MFFC18_07720 [Mariniblastus fucicola]